MIGGWILDAMFQIESGHAVSSFLWQGLDLCSMNYSRIPLIGGEMAVIHRTLFPGVGADLNWIQMIVTGIWFLLVLSIFGGAICRVVALRIARDESAGVKEALTFAMSNLRSYVQIPLVLGIAIFIFWGCNWLAGVVIGVPFLGWILFLVLYPLAILSGLIILLIAVGGLLGLFLMVAAISTEKNGTLDAISRAFSPSSS